MSVKKLLVQIVKHIPILNKYDKYAKGKNNFPGIKFPVYFRPGTIDTYTLVDIFIEKQYDIALPESFGAPEVIIDGGANIGCTSVFFANKYPSAKIIAVEPETNNFNYLLKNIEAYPNVTGLKTGIWTRPTFIEVKNAGYGYRGFIINEIDHETPDSFLATSLEELTKDYKTIDILKLDVEGSEKFIFEQGYESWLPKVKCLIIELHDRMQPGCSKSVFGAISKYNFSCELKGENLVFFNDAFL